MAVWVFFMGLMGFIVVVVFWLNKGQEKRHLRIDERLLWVEAV